MLVELNDDTGITREISVCCVFFVTNRLFSAGEPVELTLVFEYMDVTVAIEAYRFETHG
jgi:hypothetical protein